MLAMAAGGPAAAQQVNPVSWRVSISPAVLGPQRPAVVRVDASIDPGWHLYSATQAAGGPMATKVELVENAMLGPAGELRQSKFERKHDPVFDMDVEAFSHQAWFELPVRANSETRPGGHEAQVRVRFQACSGRICLLPAERLLTLKFLVEPATAKASAPAKSSPKKTSASEDSTEAAKRTECTQGGGIRGFYTEIAYLFWADADTHRRKIVCVPALLGQASPRGDDLYFAGMLWLRYDRHETSAKNLENAAALLTSYLVTPEPRYFEESALANAASTLAALRRFDEAKGHYAELKKKYGRRSSSHEQWADSTNLAWAGSALVRELTEAKRYEELEAVAREYLDYLKERESSTAWSLAAEAARLLLALEEQGKNDAASAYRKELTDYFTQHGGKYPAAADFWLTTTRVRELEPKDPAAALAVLEGKREVYRKAGFERSYDLALARLKLYDSPAPPFEAALWINSEPLTLEKVRGNVVLLDFWASWCAPCRKDFPALEELSKKRAADGLVVIGVTQNDGWFMTAAGKTLGRGEGNKLSWEQETGLLHQFVKDFQMTMPVMVGRRPEDPNNRFASAETLQRYGIQAFPTTILIDRGGVVRYIGDREGEKYETTLARLLSEKTTRLEEK